MRSFADLIFQSIATSLSSEMPISSSRQPSGQAYKSFLGPSERFYIAMRVILNFIFAGNIILGITVQ